MSMRSLMILLVAFCLVSFALTKPFPEEDEEVANGTEEPKENEEGYTTEETAGDDAGDEKEEDGEEKTEDGGDEDAGGEKTDGADGGGEDGTAKQEGEEGGDDAAEDNGGKGEGKNNPFNTYTKVIELLDKTTKIDKIESGYLRSALTNDLQAYLRNPIVDAIGTVGDYSKISSCFQSMVNDVKNIVDEDLKTFKSCTSKKDSNEHQCSESRSTAQGKIAQLATKITSCVSSKRSSE